MFCFNTFVNLHLVQLSLQPLSPVFNGSHKLLPSFLWTPQASLLLKRSKLFLLKIPLKTSHCAAQLSAAPVKAHQHTGLPIKRRGASPAPVLPFATCQLLHLCVPTGMQIHNDQAFLELFASVSFVFACLFVCLLWFLEKHTTGSDVKKSSGSGSVCFGFHTNLFLVGQLPDSWATFLHLRLKSIWFMTVDFHSGKAGGGGGTRRLNVTLVAVSSDLIGPAQAALCHLLFS